MRDQLRLTLVTHKASKSTQDYLDFIHTCAQSGITAVQLREKNLAYSDLLAFGKSLKNLLAPLQVRLLINDSLELCQALDADGLHLGQDDGHVIDARKALGSHKIIGLTVNTLQQIEEANHLPIDYIGVGAIYPTQNKSNISTIWGIKGLQQAVSLSHHPIVAIGGIDASNAQAVMQSGVYGIAAIGAFHDAIDPQATTKMLRKLTGGVYPR